jgi:hypothetical protein
LRAPFRILWIVLTMMLYELIDPIIAAMHRHAARLELLAQNDRPGISNQFREESARICGNEIQDVVEAAFQTIVDAEPNLTKKIILLADSQKRLKDLVNPRLPQVNNRPDEGSYTVFVQGSIDAARAVYAKISQDAAHLTAQRKSFAAV